MTQVSGQRDDSQFAGPGDSDHPANLGLPTYHATTVATHDRLLAQCIDIGILHGHAYIAGSTLAHDFTLSEDK